MSLFSELDSSDLILAVFTLSQTICFHGTCGFTCHCKDQSSDDVECECEEGSVWSGEGCQIGNMWLRQVQYDYI